MTVKQIQYIDAIADTLRFDTMKELGQHIDAIGHSILSVSAVRGDDGRVYATVTEEVGTN